jgi:hypothetical protein
MSYEDLEDLLGDETFDYVEDTYIEADDLAEHAVPSPPPMDYDEEFDMDLWQYDYWMDIDYASDGDEIRQRRLDSRTTRAKKRKLVEEARGSPSKKRKLLARAKGPTGRAQPIDELATVVMIKHAADQRNEPQDMRVVDIRPLKTQALLKDWRQKFQNTPMWPKKKPAIELEEVQDAPDDDDLDQDEEMGDMRTLIEAATKNVAELGEEEWEDEDEEDEADEPMDLDPEALKMAIKQNLAAAGVNVKGMDEETLMRFAMKMFAGEGEGDDLVGEMADQLLGGQRGDATDNETEDTENEESGFAGWVQKQAEEKAAKKEQVRGELPTPADSEGKPSASPPENRTGKGIAAARDGEEQRGTKRKADDGAVHVSEAKRAARRFDAPTAASKARAISSAGPASRKGRKG